MLLLGSQVHEMADQMEFHRKVGEEVGGWSS